MDAAEGDATRICTNRLTAGAPLDSHGMLPGEIISAGREVAATELEPIHLRGPAKGDDGEELMSPTSKSRDGGVDMLWFKKKCEFETKHSHENKQHFLDFYKKYTPAEDGGPTEPTTDLGEISYAWAIVFALPDMEEEKWKQKANGDKKQLVHPECWSVIQRLWNAHLEVAMEPSSNGEEMHVSVGASYEVLVDEANVIKPRMRMINCKGTSLFDSEMISNYMPSLFDVPEKATCFSSAQVQELVMSRIERIAGVKLDERVRSLSRERAMELVTEDLEAKRSIRGRRIREMLTTHGAFRPNAAEILGKEVEMLREQVTADPFFKIDPEHQLSKRELAMLHAEEEHMRKRGLKVPKYEDVIKVVEILQEYTSKEPGLTEEFTGSVKMFFPLHHEDELDFLKHHWGSYSLICTPFAKGKKAEAAGTDNYFRASMEDRHVSAFYTPIDTIRDYFGEHVGLYQAWLTLYTRYLCYPAFTGLVIQLYQLFAADVDSNNNWLMVPYSIFLCLWSAQFNSAWTRRENELKFLWGSELVEDEEPVRADFKGVLVIDPVTQDEEIQYYSSAARFTRIILSTCVSVAIVLSVVFMAFTATTVRFNNAPDPSTVYCAEMITFEGPLMFNGTQQNVTIDGIDTGLPIVVNITEHLRIENIYSKVECQALAEEETTDVLGIMGGISVIHHVDEKDVIHTTWIDGWPAGTSNFDKNKWGWLSALLNTLMIVIFGNVYESCAVSLTDWENHRTRTEYDDQLILKNFGFQFVNNYFVLFYIGYMRQIDTSSFGGPPVEVTECRSGTCLGQLQTQIVVVFTTKTMIAQLLEIFKPIIKARAEEMKHLLRIRDLENALMDVSTKTAGMVMNTEAKEMMGLDKDSLAHEKAQAKKEEEMRMRLAAAVSDDSHSAVERESYLLPYTSTFDDFNEMAIQFGYLALFSPVYPLAAFLALLNNILEIRVDAAKLCYATRRPTWTGAADIGSWYTVMNVLGFIAVITNATMITFVGKLLADTHEAAQGGLNARTKEWNLWFIAVCVEHSVLIGRVLILTVLPATPGWIETAKKQLAWHQDAMKPGREILEGLALHTQYKDKYDVEDHDVHPEVERFMGTKNSIREHMEDKGIGPEKKAAEREEKRVKALAAIERGEQPAKSSSKPKKEKKKDSTINKVTIKNPLQESLGEFDIEDFSDEDSDDDHAHPTAAIYSDGGFDADGHQVKYNCISTCPIREKFDAGSEVIGQLEKGEEVYVLEVKDHDHFRIDRGWVDMHHPETMVDCLVADPSDHE